MPELLVEVWDQMGQKHWSTFLYIQKPSTNENLICFSFMTDFYFDLFSVHGRKSNCTFKKKPYISHPH